MILNQDKGDAVRLGLEVELIIASTLGIAGFIGAVLLDRHSNSREVVEQLEEKLLRESERNSFISDFGSLYSHNSFTKGDSSRFQKRYVLPSADSNNTNSTLMEEGFGGGDDDSDSNGGRGSSRAASSSVAEDEFYVPDYF
jgi:hypothetical protein